VLFVVLALLVVAWFAWRWRTRTLTRYCRWRQDRAAGDWHCLYCGARTVTEDGAAPRHCALRQEDRG
jgi:hypothetical protein